MNVLHRLKLIKSKYKPTIMIITNTIMAPSELREEARLEWIKKHHNILSNLGYDPWFQMKMVFTPTGKPKGENYIGLYEDELEIGKDLYTVYTNKDHKADPKADSLGNLHKWKFDPHWSTNLEQYKSKKGYMSYIIPVTDLTLVVEKTGPIQDGRILEVSDQKQRDYYPLLKEIRDLLVGIEMNSRCK